MYKALLTLFLTLSMATQVASISLDFDGSTLSSGKFHAPAKLRPYNTDFDDNRRGLNSFIVPARNHPLARATPLDYADTGESFVDFCLTRLPLFKLHASFLI